METTGRVVVPLPESGETNISVDGPLIVEIDGDSDGGEGSVVVNGMRIDFAPTSLKLLDEEFVVPSVNMMGRIRDAIALIVSAIEQLSQKVSELEQRLNQ